MLSTTILLNYQASPPCSKDVVDSIKRERKPIFMANFSSSTSKKMIYGSWGVAGLVGVVSLIDIFAKAPFRGQVMMDIFFILGAGLIGYLGYDAYKDLR